MSSYYDLDNLDWTESDRRKIDRLCASAYKGNKAALAKVQEMQKIADSYRNH